MESEMKAAEGWEKYKVRDICELGRGRVISGQEIERNPGIFPVYSSQSSNNGKMGTIDTFDFDGEYVTWTTDGAYAGTVFYRSGHFNCTNVCGTLRAKDTRVCMSFLAYKLSTLAKGYVSYVGNPKLMNGVMADIEFSIPISKLEQTKIAEILSTVDRAIEQTEALIAKQQRIKTGLMQDLLTRGIDKHGNLRSEQTHQFKDSALGRIPVEWEVARLDRCVRSDSPICYGILMPGTGHENGVPVIKVKDIIGGCIIQDGLLLTDPKIDSQYKRSKLHTGDLLITIRGTTGRVALVPPELDRANITQDTARVRLENEYSCQYFYFLLQSKTIQDQVELHTIGQAVKGINIGEVKKLFFGLPNNDEQHKIAERLTALEEDLGSTDRKLKKLRSLKTALMQDLLTGNKRVTPLVDKEEEAA